MKRAFILACIAIALLVVVLAVLFINNSRTLATKTVNLGQSAVVFKIIDRQGRLYATAHEKTLWSHGWRTMVFIGTVAEIGDSNAAIVFDRDRERVQLNVGMKTVDFDEHSQSFQVP
ncbi:MAG: hypothetical protein K8T91_12575 [Planctomycetes bacterium]|nr:hypothetical protein [Planctomycetota bacterium]